MSATKTVTAAEDKTSDVYVRPFDQVTYSVTVGGGDSFHANSRVRFEISEKPDENFVLDTEYSAVTASAVTWQNGTGKPVYVRLRSTAHAGDDILLAVNDVDTGVGDGGFRNGEFGNLKVTESGIEVTGTEDVTGAATAASYTASGAVTGGSLETAGDLDAQGEVLDYGEISVEGNSTGTGAFAGAGVANKKQIAAWDTNGESRNTTPDHTEDHITIGRAGKYLVSFSASISGAANDTIAWAAYKNNGDTQFANVYATRKIGSGGDVGRGACQGIVDLAATDTLEIWIWNENDTSEVVVEDACLTCIRIGA